MKNIFKTFLIALLIGAGVMVTSTVHATDGYFGVGYGALNKGVAGAGIAWYNNSLMNGNPAGHVMLGNQYDIGLGFFNPNRQFTVTGDPSGMPGTFGLTPGTVESDSKLFYMPSLGANWMIGEKSSISATFFGNGGMNTDYPTQAFYDASSSTTGVDLAQMFLGVSYSRKLGEKHSVGITALGVYQYFEANGIASFGMMSSDPTKLSGNGHDNAMGFGVKLGYMGEIIDNLTLGASYQPKINMSEFDEYSGLFAEQGDFDIPSNLTVGLAYKFSEKLAVMADYKRINYSDVAAVSNKFDPMSTDLLGSDKGAGFGWNDINVYKVGIEYGGIEGWTIRGGYSHNDQAVPESEVLFNILAPGIIEDHISLGFSKYLGESGKALHFAMVYALPATVKGYNPMDFDPVEAMAGNMVPNQTIELEMSQLEFEIAFTF
ncbi:MAG: outer membrane protein transport protein [Bacteroidales bacterium]|nr:outer membrane protein transport protein [Bacteroidales bacterium]